MSILIVVEGGRYLFVKAVKNSVLPEVILRRMQHVDDYVYTESYNKQRLDHLTFDIEMKNKKLENLSNEEINDIEQICTFKTGQEQDRIYLSKAFNCLAKINNHRYTEKDNIYKAIKNASHALEVAYLPEHVDTLSKSLIIGFEEQIPEKFNNLAPYLTGKKEDELKILNELISINIPEISARASYRLSLIHKLGRASVKEKIEPNLRLSIEEINKVIGLSNIKADNNMDITIIVNDKFAQYAASVIASALLNSNLTTFYHFYFVMDPSDPVTNESQQKLASMKWIRDYEITFINFPHGIDVKEISKQSKYTAYMLPRFPDIIAYRLYLHKIFPNLDRILYLDADLLILEDLTYFKQLDIDNYYIAAAMDAGISKKSRSKGICTATFKEFYINSGVIFFNLDKMRKEDSLSRMVNTIINCKTCDLSYMDQDILNLAFEDYIYYISYRWNDLMVHRYETTSIPEFISFIQHYSGNKPWNVFNAKQIFKTNPEKLTKDELDYWRYHEITPWSDV